MNRRFSERIEAVKVEIQIGKMDAKLRSSIWNFVANLIPPSSSSERANRDAIDLIAANVLRVPTQRVGWNEPTFWLLEQPEKMTWAEVYDLLEFAIAMGAIWKRIPAEELVKRANHLLGREHSGYRFISGKLAPITNAAEISEIEGAVRSAAASGLGGASEQIEQALKLFGRRPAPAYRNAVKEAISAVESVVKIINGTRGGGLHEALEAVSVKIEMHQALKAGLEKLYGYTSDEDGIRHAILEKPKVDEADAQFMVVTCSAFVNFLIVKADAAGLLPSQK